MFTNKYRLNADSICAWVLFPLVGLLFMAAQANAAVTVKFIFVAPAATIDANFTAANTSTLIADTQLAPGYKGAFVTPQNLAVFRRVAPPNMLRTYDVLQSGQALRAKVDRETQLNGGRTDVIFMLVDDRTGLTSRGRFCGQTVSGKTAAWPCAAQAVPITNGRYLDFVSAGELASVYVQGWPGGWQAWEGVLLHETSHTQFVGNASKWPFISIAYGGDGQHYFEELLGDQPVPWNEGMGDFFGTIHNTPAGLQSMDAFWSRTDERYLLEHVSVLAGDPALASAPHTEGRYPGFSSYRWMDVPGFYLLFTERTSEAFHANFWRHVNGNPDQAMSMIYASMYDIWPTERNRYLTFEINHLSLEMERFATTPEGQSARSAGRLTSSMFPFALLDILTHYGMTEQEYRAEYDRDHPDRQPRAYAEYWRHRQAVRDLVMPMLQASPIRMQDAINAATRYFQQPATILAAAP